MNGYLSERKKRISHKKQKYASITLIITKYINQNQLFDFRQIIKNGSVIDSSFYPLPLFKKKISKSRIFFLKPIDKPDFLLYNELVFLMVVFIV